MSPLLPNVASFSSSDPCGWLGSSAVAAKCRAIAAGVLVSAASLEAAVVYEQDFDGVAAGTTGSGLNDGSFMVGAGAHQAQVIRWGPSGQEWQSLWLTSNFRGQLGSFFLPDLNPTVAIDSFSVDFGLMFNTNGNSIYADGMSLNFGQFNNTTSAYGGEGGMYSPGATGDVLTVSWITYWAGNPRIEARFNGVTVASSTLVRPIINFDNPASAAAFVPVNVSWDANGLDVTYNGTAIFTDLAINGFEPEAGYRFAFTARTGADSQNTFVDNLVVATVPEPSAVTLGVTGLAVALWRSRRLRRRR